jgi:hypothetical protein
MRPWTAAPAAAGTVAQADTKRLFSAVALAQAAMYILTGLWPLVSIGTFQKVTGPKCDIWLVKTVGVLVTVIGAVIGVAGARRNVTPETPLLGVGSALGLAGIDIVYVAKGRIRPIYLLDALAELLLVGAWAGAWTRVCNGCNGARGPHDH